jgi:hypothetical protein
MELYWALQVPELLSQGGKWEESLAEEGENILLEIVW